MSDRRVPLALATVVCLLVAGCSGFAPAASPEPTSPTATPVEVPRAPDLDGGRLLAAGVSANGVFDPEALASAHRDRLATTTYHLVRNRTVRYANDSRAALRPRESLDFVHEESVVVPAADAYTFTKLETSRRAWTAAASYARVDVWFHEPVVRNRFVDAGGTARYWGFDDERSGGPLADPSSHRLVAADLAAVETRVTGQETVDDVTRFRLRGSSRADAANLSTPPLARDPRNVTFVGVVDERGLVVSYTLAYDATFAADGSRLRVRQTHRLRQVGDVDTARPSWLPAANESVVGSR
ncbi:hypothetical protein N0B31_03950 [Salinirubellus salinus]|uniref:Uncharacterized protein n=1 Tax=Salinirubellus salinus TaxID=1364945 RepID=A0A9E7U916_9EURY|nr:hypothetical protein [Salinirubellus salinus]UWM55441.1 hypothetical protein N0B31_03950 [Salinirubellus salinus]